MHKRKGECSSLGCFCVSQIFTAINRSLFLCHVTSCVCGLLWMLKATCMSWG